jgi:hypothetical protein
LLSVSVVQLLAPQMCENKDYNPNYENNSSPLRFAVSEGQKQKNNPNDNKHKYVKILVDDPCNNRDIILEVTKKQKGVYV